MQEDGAVAVAYQWFPYSGPSEPARVALFSPRDPSPQVSPVALAGPLATLADDRLASCRREARNLAVIDLGGTLIASLESYGSDAVCTKVAFDGQRLAWRGPLSGILRVSPFPPVSSAAPATLVPMLRGPLRLRSAISPNRAGRLVLPGQTTACPHNGGRCMIRVELRRTGRAGSPERAGASLGVARYRLRPGRRAVLSAVVSRRGRAVVRRLRRVRAVAVVSAANRAATPATKVVGVTLTSTRR